MSYLQPTSISDIHLGNSFKKQNRYYCTVTRNAVEISNILWCCSRCRTCGLIVRLFLWTAARMYMTASHFTAVRSDCHNSKTTLTEKEMAQYNKRVLRTCTPIRILGGSFCTPPYWVCDASHAGSRMFVFPLLLHLNILHKIYPYRYYNSY